MYRSLLLGLLIVAVVYPAGLLFPWWISGPIAALVCFLGRPGPGIAFAVSFVAGLLLWGGLALLADLRNESLLSTQVGQVFRGLPGVALLGMTGLIGGITAGLGGWTGAEMRRFFEKR